MTGTDSGTFGCSGSNDCSAVNIDISGIANQPTVNTGKINSVYDLSGRRLNDKSLSKGIYIINGKKVVVK